VSTWVVEKEEANFRGQGAAPKGKIWGMKKGPLLKRENTVSLDKRGEKKEGMDGVQLVAGE